MSDLSANLSPPHPPVKRVGLRSDRGCTSTENHPTRNVGIDRRQRHDRSSDACRDDARIPGKARPSLRHPRSTCCRIHRRFASHDSGRETQSLTNVLPRAHDGLGPSSLSRAVFSNDTADLQRWFCKRFSLWLLGYLAPWRFALASPHLLSRATLRRRHAPPAGGPFGSCGQEMLTSITNCVLLRLPEASRGPTASIPAPKPSN
jgi:hypothetical protein